MSLLRLSLAGIHLEGPFISPVDGYRGAHPLEHIVAPDWSLFERLRRAAGAHRARKHLRLSCLVHLRFIARLRAAGVRVAIGHSAASAADIALALEAGATPRHPCWQCHACARSTP